MVTKIKKLDAHQVKEVRKQIDVELAALGERLGLTFHAGNASYTGNKITYKLEALIEGFDPDKAEFEASCWAFELKPSDWGRLFISGGRSFKLVGIKLNRPKYPIIGEDTNGKRYKFRDDVVAQLAEATA